jgi:hypothetical protein
MKKTLLVEQPKPAAENPVVVDLYPALALAGLVGYLVWGLASAIP